MTQKLFQLTSILLTLLGMLAIARAQETVPDKKTTTLILAHYMPWYEAKPVSQAWGWHWTMNHFSPDVEKEGKREIASHYYPAIGPYDSSDGAVLEYHLLTMKLAGIDGVIVDWYGLTDHNDYAMLHRNTQKLIEQAERLQMRVVICYEDQTIPALVKANKLKPQDRVAHAVKEIDWLAEHWFSRPCYVKLEGKPVLLSFGQTGLSDEEWSQCLARSKAKVAYFSQHHRRTAAVGAFDWPVPSDAASAHERFTKESRDWSHVIPVVFPRFVDIYAEAKVGASYGKVEDDGGARFQKSLANALAAKPPIVQLATWNDWGEGTSIEPSREFGFRNLEAVQSLRQKHVDPRFAPVAADLTLPRQLLDQRRMAKDAASKERCDAIAALLQSQDFAGARAKLAASGR